MSSMSGNTAFTHRYKAAVAQPWVCRALALCLLIPLANLSCADAGANVRSTTYPSDFSQLKKKELRGHMGTLAMRVVKLGAMLSPSSPDNPTLQQDVVLLLRDMETIAGELDPATANTKHPILERNIIAFRQDLQAARAEVQGSPPSYFLAGTIAGSCRYCHR